MSSSGEEGRAERSSASPTRRNLTSGERLKKRADFDRVFSSGKRRNCPGARLVYARNGLPWNRFAVCPIKKYGGSVQRNRAKRICREVFRSLNADLKPGNDLVLVIFPGPERWEQRAEQLLCLARDARLTVNEIDAQ